MSNLTAEQFIINAKNYLGYKYIYAAKGGKYTEAEIRAFAKQYPSIYTATYLVKSLKNAGYNATDCSGLIYLASNKEYLLGSSQLLSRAKQKGRVFDDIELAPPGAVLYKPGHVGIRISSTQHIESRGVDYGVVIKNLSTQPWACALMMDFVDYIPKAPTTKKSEKYDIAWLQTKLNIYIKAGKLKSIKDLLEVDGIWGGKTAGALLAYFSYKGWKETKATGYYAGDGTINSLLA